MDSPMPTRPVLHRLLSALIPFDIYYECEFPIYHRQYLSPIGDVPSFQVHPPKDVAESSQITPPVCGIIGRKLISDSGPEIRPIHEFELDI